MLATQLNNGNTLMGMRKTIIQIYCLKSYNDYMEQSVSFWISGFCLENVALNCTIIWNNIVNLEVSKDCHFKGNDIFWECCTWIIEFEQKADFQACWIPAILPRTLYLYSRRYSDYVWHSKISRNVPRTILLNVEYVNTFWDRMFPFIGYNINSNTGDVLFIRRNSYFCEHN